LRSHPRGQCQRPGVAVDIPSALMPHRGVCFGAAVSGRLTHFHNAQSHVCDRCRPISSRAAACRRGNAPQQIAATSLGACCCRTGQVAAERPRSSHKAFGHVHVNRRDSWYGGRSCSLRSGASAAARGKVHSATRSEHVAALLSRHARSDVTLLQQQRISSIDCAGESWSSAWSGNPKGRAAFGAAMTLPNPSS